MNLTRLFVFYKTPSSHITWRQCHDRFYRIGRAQEQSRNFARKLDPSLYFQWNSSGGFWGGHPAPPIFRPDWGPEGRKKFFGDLTPALSQGLDDRPSLPSSPPPPYLNFWIHLWTVKLLYDCCKSVFLFKWNVLDCFFFFYSWLYVRSRFYSETNIQRRNLGR